MNRRVFLRGAASAPVGLAAGIAVIAPAHSAPVGYERVSCEKGDPGERAYAMACGDRKAIKVWLDGVEQKHCITADANEGWVKRSVITPAGNLSINLASGDVLEEVVHGVVTIKVV